MCMQTNIIAGSSPVFPRAMEMETSRDLVKVCNFLRERGVRSDVIDNFEYEKMDVEAITQATDNELLLLGLDKKGDILSLRNFVQKLSKDASKDERRSQKMSLLHDVLERGKGKSVGNKKDGKGEAKTRKVQLGWLHFDDEKKSFVSVRTAKGGGMREVNIKLTASKSNIIDIAKTMFFADGHSIFGPNESMTFGLANFQQEDIATITVAGVHLAFTLHRYVEKCKMSRVRLYLTSKISNSDNTCLPKPTDPKPESTVEPETKECGADGDRTKSQLLSSLEERRKIVSEQDAAYEESLASDRAKRQKLMEEVQDVQRQNKLQQTRLLRTPQEPKESDQSTSVEIKVRHVSLGIVRRNFREYECMACVYDWVGSLSIIPEHFQLLDYAGKMLLPSQPVKQAKNTTLYMSEAMTTPPLGDEEVTFLGFGVNEWEPLDDESYLMQPILDTPPEQLMEFDDESITSKLEHEQSHAQQLTKGKKHNSKRTEDGGRLFRQHYLPLLTTQQRPTPSMPLVTTDVSSQSLPSGNDQLPAGGSKNDQDLTIEVKNDQESGDDQESGVDQDSGSSGGSGGGSNGGSGSGSSGGNGGGSGGGSDSGSGSGSSGGSSGGSGGGSDSGSGSGSNGGSGSGSSGGSGGGSGGGSSGGSGGGGANDQGSHDSIAIDLNHSIKKQRILRLRRCMLLQDLVKEFIDNEVMTCELKVVMIDGQGNHERGEDVRGIYRDALASFWQEFYVSCSLGERGRVPFLRHDFQGDEWAAVGRIISKGYLDLGYFPVMLSKAFFISAMLGEKAVSDDILLQSFNDYLAPIEEQVVCEALTRTEDSWNCVGKDDEELIELLDRFGCRKLPTKDNIKSLILEVAHKEIIQKAQYVADCWDDTFKESLADSKLARLEEVCSVYKSLEPTTKKVLKMISATPGNNAERSALDFLKRFIRGLDVKQLRCFLMFVTGADVMCVSSIHVEFTKLEGLGRRPVTHTCSSLLELPATYDSYAEFRAEFTNVLAQGKWQNDIM